jgi:hypothetical protein
VFPSLDILERAAYNAKQDVRRLLLAAAQDHYVTVLGVELAALDTMLEQLQDRIRRLKRHKQSTKGRAR